jgi:hypothetical protein
MRYRSVLLLTLLSTIGRAQTAPDAIAVANGPLAISLRDANGAPPAVLTALQQEVESIMAPSGIQITWLSPDTSQNGDITRLAVIRLIGQCRTDTPIPAAARFSKGDVEALGQTHVVDGKVLPIADIRCDAVRSFIHSDLRSTSAFDREQLLGRALGRVLVHELYHVLLRTRNHGREGLSRPAQSSVELLASRTQFARQDERRLSESSSVELDNTGVETGR